MYDVRIYVRRSAVLCMMAVFIKNFGLIEIGKLLINHIMLRKFVLCFYNKRLHSCYGYKIKKIFVYTFADL